MTLARKANDRAGFGKAMDYFKRAIDSDPQYASAYNGLGAVYRLTGGLDAAITCWGEALKCDLVHKLPSTTWGSPISTVG